MSFKASANRNLPRNHLAAKNAAHQTPKKTYVFKSGQRVQFSVRNDGDGKFTGHVLPNAKKDGLVRIAVEFEKWKPGTDAYALKSRLADVKRRILFFEAEAKKRDTTRFLAEAKRDLAALEEQLGQAVKIHVFSVPPENIQPVKSNDKPKTESKTASPRKNAVDRLRNKYRGEGPSENPQALLLNRLRGVGFKALPQRLHVREKLRGPRPHFHIRPYDRSGEKRIEESMIHADFHTMQETAERSHDLITQLQLEFSPTGIADRLIQRVSRWDLQDLESKAPTSKLAAVITKCSASLDANIRSFSEDGGFFSVRDRTSYIKYRDSVAPGLIQLADFQDAVGTFLSDSQTATALFPDGFDDVHALLRLWLAVYRFPFARKRQIQTSHQRAFLGQVIDWLKDFPELDITKIAPLIQRGRQFKDIR